MEYKNKFVIVYTTQALLTSKNYLMNEGTDLFSFVPGLQSIHCHSFDPN
jgi:polyphosphate kinase